MTDLDRIPVAGNGLLDRRLVPTVRHCHAMAHELVSDLTEIRTCLGCGTIFSDIISIGKNECRRHRGVMQGHLGAYGTFAGTFSCCNVSSDPTHPQYAGYDASRGCILADHTHEPGLPADVTVPYDHARVIFGGDIDRRNVERHGAFITIHRTRSVAATTHQRRRT